MRRWRDAGDEPLVKHLTNVRSGVISGSQRSKPKRKNPARHAAKRGLVIIWVSLSERDALTPQPSRPADLKGEGVKPLAPPWR